MHRLTETPLPGTTVDPLYPSSSAAFGEDMSESDWHTIAVIALREVLLTFFAGRPDVYVASQMFFYYEQGNPAAHRDPDVLVARGVRGNHFRHSFRLWEERVLPCTLFEMASEKTWRSDVEEKGPLYERLGIPEFFLFDPEGVYLDPVFRGFRLRARRYVPIRPDSDGCLVSRRLGLKFRPEGGVLRVFNATTGEPLLTPAERADQQQQRADAAEAELARLRAELARRPDAPGAR